MPFYQTVGLLHEETKQVQFTLRLVSEWDMLRSGTKTVMQCLKALSRLYGPTTEEAVQIELTSPGGGRCQKKVYADLHGKISTQWDMPRSGTKTATQCLKALVLPRMGRSRKMFDNSSDIGQRLDLFTLFTASQICGRVLCFRTVNF